MLSMDVFRSNAFSATSLTAVVDKIGYVPQFLDTIPGLFVPTPVRTVAVWIEARDSAPALIHTSPRGSAPPQKERELRDARAFSTLRLAQSSRIEASELQGIRDFGSETELMQLQKETARRQLRMKNDNNLTLENWRLGVVQGALKDSDGATLYNWATEFGQTIPAELDFDLDNASPASGAVRKNCNTVVRSITKALKGLGGASVKIYGLCGDAFWDDLTAHPEVRQIFLNTVEAQSLLAGNTWQSFTYGAITFVNYRGSDDGTSVSVGTDNCKFFPAGAGIFPIAYSPAEKFEFVNTLGQPYYSWTVPDRDRDMWIDIEQYSYPLPICTMPSALHRARRT